MRIALVDSNPNPKVYPLPLLKIGAWRKSLGDYCEIYNNRLPKHNKFDEIWITTTFTYDIPHALAIVKEARERSGQTWVGGISATLLPDKFKRLKVNVHRGLLPEAEKFNPDYSLIGKSPEYSISHTSRGCIRKCEFCMVRKLEPIYTNRRGWENDIHPETKKVIFFDNNWLAKKRSDLKHDIDMLKKFVKSGKISSIDFNQGLDARLVDEKIANLLQGLPIKPVRFAFDGMHEDGYCQNAIKMMAKRGFKDFMTYVLYNFDDTPNDFYYRLREITNLALEYDIDCKSFPMRYQPILDIDPKRLYVGKHWTYRKRNNVKLIINQHSGGGQVSCTGGSDGTDPIGEFEYWFGKDAKEFNKLLTYPKLSQFMKRKKGALRIKRAIINKEINGNPRSASKRHTTGGI